MATKSNNSVTSHSLREKASTSNNMVKTHTTHAHTPNVSFNEIIGKQI